MMPRNTGARPQLIWVAVADLVIDDSYQRPLGRHNWTAIRGIAAAFDWARYTPVMVAPLADEVGGERPAFALIDGQHRAHAALMAGVTHVPALVIDIPVDQQAAAFAAINTQRTAVSPFHLYRAALTARQDWALRSKACVEAAGCRLMTSNRSASTRKGREIFAVTLVREHITADRDAVVTAGLKALAESSDGDNSELFVNRILRPWLTVLTATPALMKRDLTNFVSGIDLVRLCARAGDDPARAGLSQYQAAMRAIVSALDDFVDPVAELAIKRPAKRVMAARLPQQAPALPAGLRPNEDWTPDRDAELVRSKGKYAVPSQLADKWGLSQRAVTARWHLVRAQGSARRAVV